MKVPADRRFLFLVAGILACSSSIAQVEIEKRKIDFISAHTHYDSVIAAFNVADNYMDAGRYDSAQLWLNVVNRIHLVKEPSLFNFYLFSRQSEICYYNGLFQIGLQSALQALEVAERLNDSLLIADGCNLAGLLFLELGSLSVATGYFYRGIDLSRVPPYSPRYSHITWPHHLWGNLGETYEKRKLFDSAAYSYRRSLKYATVANQSRGISVALQGIAQVYAVQKLLDSARWYYTQSISIAKKVQRDFDVALISYAGLSDVSLQSGSTAEAARFLQIGLEELKRNQIPVPNLALLQFYKQAAKIYSALNDDENLSMVLKEYSACLVRHNELTVRQFARFLESDIENKNRILRLESTDNLHRARQARANLLFALITIVLLIVGIVLFWLWTRKRLEAYQIRSRISKDLHDEIGATLSGVALLSQFASSQLEAGERKAAQDYINRIAHSSKEMVDKMQDIVWSIKFEQEKLYQIIERVERYASGICSTRSINFSINTDGIRDTNIKDLKLKRHLYFIIKEAINNAVKHSGCDILKLMIGRNLRSLIIEISDNGIGFDLNSHNPGNGLVNLRTRAAEINADIVISSSLGRGTKILIMRPLKHPIGL